MSLIVSRLNCQGRSIVPSWKQFAYLPTNPVKDKSQLVAALRDAVKAANGTVQSTGGSWGRWGSMEYLSAVYNAINPLIGLDAAIGDPLQDRSEQDIAGTQDSITLYQRGARPSLGFLGLEGLI